MTIKFRAACAAAFALFVWTAGPVAAEEFRLPDPVELQTFSRDAMPFYVAGIAALDHADFGNAYSSLAKAAQLQPDAVRLNQIVAALAMKLGRSKPAAEARGFYETAIVSYESVLRNQALDEDFRRDVFNRLKIAKDERDNLEQRDARRESIGTYFIQELNRSYVEAARKADQAASPAAATPPGAPPGAAQPLPPGYSPFPQAGAPGAAPLQGAPGTIPGAPGGVGAYPGTAPQAYPGANPAAAPLPGAPPAPGAPGGGVPI